MIVRGALLTLLFPFSLNLAFSASPLSYAAHRGTRSALQGGAATSPRRPDRHVTGLCMLSVAEANEALRQAQDEALQSLLQGGLGLEGREEFSEAGVSVRTWTGDDVAWCSAVRADRLSTLTSWNGPLKAEVPHLCSRVAASDAGIEISLDLCPRGDAGYELADAQGNFPEPTSRQMFMQGQLRNDYAAAFFTPSLDQLVGSIRSLPGVQQLPSNRDPKVVGPIGLDVLVPLSGDSLAVAAAMCKASAGLYVSWMQGAERAGQTASQMAFAHDCKVRAAMLRYNTEWLVGKLGPELGESVATVDAGPRDQSDRGGSMSRAAGDNFKPNPLQY